MTEAEKRENGRRCYELALAIERLGLLYGRYAEARKRRHGQRKAFVDLRDHVAFMLRQGL